MHGKIKLSTCALNTFNQICLQPFTALKYYFYGNALAIIFQKYDTDDNAFT